MSLHALDLQWRQPYMFYTVTKAQLFTFYIGYNVSGEFEATCSFKLCQTDKVILVSEARPVENLEESAVSNFPAISNPLKIKIFEDINFFVLIHA